MNAWTRFLPGVLALGAMITVSDLGTRALWAAESAGKPAVATSSQPGQTTAVDAATATAAKAPAASPGTLSPRVVDSSGFKNGTGLAAALVFLVAAVVGLTITFRALIQDMRGRRRRYRRRVRRDADSARA
jgi:hypothetical protein